jgi:hypothetical protein
MRIALLTVILLAGVARSDIPQADPVMIPDCPALSAANPLVIPSCAPLQLIAYAPVFQFFTALRTVVLLGSTTPEYKTTEAGKQVATSAPDYAKTEAGKQVATSAPDYAKTEAGKQVATAAPDYAKTEAGKQVATAAPDYMRTSVGDHLVTSVPDYMRTSVGDHLVTSVPDYMRTSVGDHLVTSVPDYARTAFASGYGNSRQLVTLRPTHGLDFVTDVVRPTGLAAAFYDSAMRAKAAGDTAGQLHWEALYLQELETQELRNSFRKE